MHNLNKFNDYKEEIYPIKLVGNRLYEIDKFYSLLLKDKNHSFIEKVINKIELREEIILSISGIILLNKINLLEDVCRNYKVHVLDVTRQQIEEDLVSCFQDVMDYEKFNKRLSKELEEIASKLYNVIVTIEDYSTIVTDYKDYQVSGRFRYAVEQGLYKSDLLSCKYSIDRKMKLVSNDFMTEEILQAVFKEKIQISSIMSIIESLREETNLDIEYERLLKKFGVLETRTN